MPFRGWTEQRSALGRGCGATPGHDESHMRFAGAEACEEHGCVVWLVGVASWEPRGHRDGHPSRMPGSSGTKAGWERPGVFLRVAEPPGHTRTGMLVSTGRRSPQKCAAQPGSLTGPLSESRKETGHRTVLQEAAEETASGSSCCGPDVQGRALGAGVPGGRGCGKDSEWRRLRELT